MARLQSTLRSWDLTLGSSTATGCNLMLSRDATSASVVTMTLDPAEEDAPFHAQELTAYWVNTGTGGGYSRKTPQSAGGYAYADAGWSLTPGVYTPPGILQSVSMPGTVSTNLGFVSDIQEFHGDLYVTHRQDTITRLPGMTTGAMNTAFKASNGEQIYDLEVFDDYLWGAGDMPADGLIKYESSTATTAWTTAGAAGAKRFYLTQVYWTPNSALAGASGAGVGAQRLIGVSRQTLPESRLGFYHCPSGSNPLATSAWSPAAYTPIGDKSYPIKGLIASNRVVWFAKRDGVYAVGEMGYSPNMTPWMRRFLHPDKESNLAVEYWNGAIWIAHMRGMAMVPLTGERQDVPQWLSFGYGASNEGPVRGVPYALCPAGEALLVAYFNDADTYIGAIKLEGGQYRWHAAICKVTGQVVTAMRVIQNTNLTITRPYLWLGTQAISDQTPHLYVADYPLTENPWLDYLGGYGMKFALTSDLYLTAEDYGDTAQKVLAQVDLLADNLGGANAIVVSAKADNGTSWITIGTAATSPRSQVLATTTVAGGAISLKLSFANATTAPIALRQVKTRVFKTPETTKVYRYTVVYGEGSQSRGMGTDPTNPATIEKRLLAMAGSRQQLVNELGKTLVVWVRPNMQLERHENAAGLGWSGKAVFEVRVLTDASTSD